MAAKKEKIEEEVKEEKKTTKKTTKSNKVDEKKEKKPTTQKKIKVKESDEVVEKKKTTAQKTKLDEGKKVEKKETSKKKASSSKKVNSEEKDKKETKSKETVKTKKTGSSSKNATTKKKSSSTSKKSDKKEENKSDKKKVTRVYAKKDIEEVAATVENNIEIQSDETKKDKLIKIEEIKDTIKNKKTIPVEEINKINKLVFKNILIGAVIVLYFLFLNLGHINIETSIYITDLKVFSACILLFAIVILEYAYKKDSGEYAVYGIEMIVLSIVSVSLIYINLMLFSRYIAIVTAISLVWATYYVIKATIIYLRKRKKYFVDDMKEIIKEEE